MMRYDLESPPCYTFTPMGRVLYLSQHRHLQFNVTCDRHLAGIGCALIGCNLGVNPYIVGTWNQMRSIMKIIKIWAKIN